MNREIQNYISRISYAIIWCAQERMKVEPHQNINSAIHGTILDIEQLIMEFMSQQDAIERERKFNASTKS